MASKAWVRRTGSMDTPDGSILRHAEKLEQSCHERTRALVADVLVDRLSLATSVDDAVASQQRQVLRDDALGEL
jgi:hypothetical protein